MWKNQRIKLQCSTKLIRAKMRWEKERKIKNEWIEINLKFTGGNHKSINGNKIFKLIIKIKQNHPWTRKCNAEIAETIANTVYVYSSFSFDFILSFTFFSNECYLWMKVKKRVEPLPLSSINIIHDSNKQTTMYKVVLVGRWTKQPNVQQNSTIFMKNDIQ